ncbi:MAG: hypothetical protein HFG57_04805 [Lachnospiraceae bacterium]|nr:hypothetical protein [Lachnospiraceae bacterium]
MKKANVQWIRSILCMTGMMMIFSLTACTPTPEKGRTGEVKQTQAANGVATNKNPDPTAPDLEVVSIYNVSEDGTKLEGTMDAVEELNPQVLTDLLIQYNVLEEGTKLISFAAEGAPSSEEVGPGVLKVPGMEIQSDTKEYGTLNLSKFPDAKNEILLQAVANTFLENLNVVYLTIQVDGETVAENLSIVDAGK